jgi:hypothetical protein
MSCQFVPFGNVGATAFIMRQLALEANFHNFVARAAVLLAFGPPCFERGNLESRLKPKQREAFLSNPIGHLLSTLAPFAY